MNRLLSFLDLVAEQCNLYWSSTTEAESFSLSCFTAKNNSLKQSNPSFDHPQTLLDPHAFVMYFPLVTVPFLFVFSSDVASF